MASELVNSATSEKLAEVDWAKNIEICELVARDQSQAKYVIKAIKKRLGGKSMDAQLFAVVLLEMLMNDIGETVHKQVIEAGLLPILVKIVKKKSDLPLREKIFFLLDATQTAFGGASGKFPQYYTAYYELVRAGVKFPQRVDAISSNPPSSGENQNNLSVANIASANEERATRREDSQPPGSSIIEKANATVEVLREVLNAVNAQNPQAAKDEFTLDLVEQCSFQKDRVMHLAMTCRDERLVSQAIELNEQLGQVLARHEALVSHRFPSTEIPMEHHDGFPLTSNHINHLGQGSWASNHINHASQSTASNHINDLDHEESEEEEEEQLSHRIRKGKANKAPLSATSIPPPPAKRVERERFFQEKRGDDTALVGHMRGLSLHSRNVSSSSYTGSLSSTE